MQGSIGYKLMLAICSFSLLKTVLLTFVKIPISLQESIKASARFSPE
jgi:hypothetical protein